MQKSHSITILLFIVALVAIAAFLPSCSGQRNMCDYTRSHYGGYK